MAVSQAISQLNGVDRRLLALFWHLAERWGRITANGVAVPMTLSHRVLAQLVGARRPTVSSALTELGERGELVRRDDGTWLLTGAPIGVPTPQVERVIQHRRRFLPSEPEPPPATPAGSAVLHRGAELRQTVERLRVASERSRRQFAESRDLARELCWKSMEIRQRRARLERAANDEAA
jgi:Crp-like helix-turn-helix domain